MNDLAEKKCKVCKGDAAVITMQEAFDLLSGITGWELLPSGKEICRKFSFKNFNHTMAFVNAVALIANQEGHHPDLEVGYNYCRIRYSTHAVNGLTENDFICAAKINSLGS